MLGNVSMLMTGCAGSVMDNIFCACGNILAGYAFVTHKWLGVVIHE